MSVRETPDSAIEGELAFAALMLATATTPAARRDAWATICELQDERDVRLDLKREAGGGDDSATG